MEAETTNIQSTNLHNTMLHTTYRFIHQQSLNFGQALYIVGNIQQLGSWNINCALRLDCYYQKYWILDVKVPVDTQIQYKFFISSYEHHFTDKGVKITQKNWIGKQKKFNFTLFLAKRDAFLIQQTRKTNNLKIMSFNLRLQTKDDKDELHWNNRAENCLQVIKQNYPSILGVQEPRRTQKPYLCQNLKHLYNYIGVPRETTGDGQEVGIFYDKQRFILIEYKFKWISETRVPGSIGFGARLPRYYTFLILQDTYTSQKLTKIIKRQQQQIKTWIPRNLIMVQNVHLDHQSSKARQKGAEMMAQQISQKKLLYQDELKDIFVFGDFNTNETPQVFGKFQEINPCLISIRKYFDRKNLRDLCDYQYTFNGFRQKESDINNPDKVIDHLLIHNQVYRPQKFMVIRKMIHKPCNPRYCIVSDHFPILGVFKPIYRQS